MRVRVQLPTGNPGQFKTNIAELRELEMAVHDEFGAQPEIRLGSPLMCGLSPEYAQNQKQFQ